MKEELQELNKFWKEARPDYNFFTDGILNYDVWQHATPKIMFLLKETADDFVNISDNHTINIKEGNETHFWWNISYWKYVVNKLYSSESPEYIEKSKLPEAINNYFINDIAYVNIKKNCDNKTSTNSNEILAYAHKDKNYLVQQIDSIEPHVIFCNSTTFKSYNILYPDELQKINSIYHKHNIAVSRTGYPAICYVAQGFSPGRPESRYTVHETAIIDF